MRDLLSFLQEKVQTTTGRERQQYRTDLAKALIESYPKNTPINIREFAAALDYVPNAAYTFLERVIAKGHISKVSGKGGKSSTYSVLTPGNSYFSERSESEVWTPMFKNTDDNPVNKNYQQAVEQINQAEHEPTETVTEEPRMAEQTYTLTELEDLAIKAQFYNGGKALSIADFLKQLKGE